MRVVRGRSWCQWLALVLATGVVAQGCQSVSVHSTPYGADVFVDGERIGQTPCKFKASTVIGCEYHVEVRLKGYKTYIEDVESDWGPGASWNLASSLIFLSPLIVLTPFFGDVVPGAVFAPLEPAPPPASYVGSDAPRFGPDPGPHGPDPAGPHDEVH